MGKLGITYQELVDLGFKRFDYTDSVYFRQHGQMPFVMFFRLSKTIKIEIANELDYAILYQAKKRPYKSNFSAFMELHTREQIQQTLAVFGYTEKAEQLNNPNQARKEEPHG